MGVAISVAGGIVVGIGVFSYLFQCALARALPYEADLRSRDGNRFLAGWFCLGVVLLIAGAIVHVLPEPPRPPVVDVRKIINPGGTRFICYIVQYYDGSADQDSYIDFEPFGAMNQLCRRRNGKEYTFSYNELGAMQEFPNLRPEERATPGILHEFQTLRDAIEERINLDSLPWLDTREQKPMQNVQETERIKMLGHLVLDELAKPPLPWDSQSAE